MVVFLSSVTNVAAPFLFSRLIDRLPEGGVASPLLWGFASYAVLLGLASALQHMVQYLSFMSAENLGFIEALPDGFDTKVGERGLKLSGGERQRIAIARALYGDPAILLLDEASSALDEATEHDIMEHIRLLASDVTVIAITHRQNIILNTDEVVELDHPSRHRRPPSTSPTP